MKDFGKLCGGCFVHAESPDVDRAPKDKRIFGDISLSCLTSPHSVLKVCAIEGHVPTNVEMIHCAYNNTSRLFFCGIIEFYCAVLSYPPDPCPVCIILPTHGLVTSDSYHALEDIYHLQFYCKALKMPYLRWEVEFVFNFQVVSSCVPQINHEMNHEDTLNHNYSGYPKVAILTYDYKGINTATILTCPQNEHEMTRHEASRYPCAQARQVVPGISQVKSPSTTMSSNMNEMEHDRTDGDSCILDLVYITERIICKLVAGLILREVTSSYAYEGRAMSFASEEHENTYKYNLKEVTRMLKTKHGENYLPLSCLHLASGSFPFCLQPLSCLRLVSSLCLASILPLGRFCLVSSLCLASVLTASCLSLISSLCLASILPLSCLRLIFSLCLASILPLGRFRFVSSLCLASVLSSASVLPPSCLCVISVLSPASVLPLSCLRLVPSLCLASILPPGHFRLVFSLCLASILPPGRFHLVSSLCPASILSNVLVTMVINISEKKSDLAKHCPQVLEFGWPDNLAPPLERLCSICKAIDQWMASDINHVMVVHCKGGRGRIAVVIAAADQALDRFAMKRFYDDKLGGLPQPSQRRALNWTTQVIVNTKYPIVNTKHQINSSALYLHHILIHGVPNFDTNGGCRPFIKVYQGMHPIFTSGVYNVHLHVAGDSLNVTDNMQKVCISISPGIPLRGDILIKCYHKKNNAGQRDIIWGCQFHTCAISHNSLVFSKNELDDAINDPRFPDPGKVEFVFGNNSEGLVQVADFKSDVTVPVDDSTEAMTRWDSYENFGKTEGKLTVLQSLLLDIIGLILATFARHLVKNADEKKKVLTWRNIKRNSPSMGIIMNVVIPIFTQDCCTSLQVLILTVSKQHAIVTHQSMKHFIQHNVWATDDDIINHHKTDEVRQDGPDVSEITVSWSFPGGYRGYMPKGDSQKQTSSKWFDVLMACRAFLHPSFQYTLEDGDNVVETVFTVLGLAAKTLKKSKSVMLGLREDTEAFLDLINPDTNTTRTIFKDIDKQASGADSTAMGQRHLINQGPDTAVYAHRCNGNDYVVESCLDKTNDIGLMPVTLGKGWRGRVTGLDYGYKSWIAWFNAFAGMIKQDNRSDPFYPLVQVASLESRHSTGRKSAGLISKLYGETSLRSEELMTGLHFRIFGVYLIVCVGISWDNSGLYNACAEQS
ncbi:TENS1-like protein [Mya arenaria]|uniref:TENS1-like protein n=1 Tax=Mya arenaria TaxID=6604 RepID=A0ABY7ETT8_MYAAR|nr:TENS1-like protein [Mya arenaria]